MCVWGGVRNRTRKKGERRHVFRFAVFFSDLQPGRHKRKGNPHDAMASLSLSLCFSSLLPQYFLSVKQVSQFAPFPLSLYVLSSFVVVAIRSNSLSSFFFSSSLCSLHYSQKNRSLFGRLSDYGDLLIILPKILFIFLVPFLLCTVIFPR